MPSSLFKGTAPLARCLTALACSLTSCTPKPDKSLFGHGNRSGGLFRTSPTIGRSLTQKSMGSLTHFLTGSVTQLGDRRLHELARIQDAFVIGNGCLAGSSTESIRLRQAGVAHQVTIALARCAAAFVEGPNHQALSTAAVARGEHFWNARLVLAVFGLDVGARVAFDAAG